MAPVDSCPLINQLHEGSVIEVCDLIFSPACHGHSSKKLKFYLNPQNFSAMKVIDWSHRLQVAIIFKILVTHGVAIGDKASTYLGTL